MNGEDLPQHDHPREGRKKGIDAHIYAEECRTHVAERHQVRGVRDDRAKHSGDHRIQQRRTRLAPRRYQIPDPGLLEHLGYQGGGCRPLQPGQPLTHDSIQNDVGRPAGGPAPAIPMPRKSLEGPGITRT